MPKLPNLSPDPRSRNQVKGGIDSNTNILSHLDSKCSSFTTPTRRTNRRPPPRVFLTRVISIQNPRDICLPFGKMKLTRLFFMLLVSFSLANPVSNAEPGALALSEADVAAPAGGRGAIATEGTIEARQASCRVTNRGGLNVLLHRFTPPLAPFSCKPIVCDGKVFLDMSQQTTDVPDLSRVRAHAVPIP